MTSPEHYFESRYGRVETERRLAAFFESQKYDPAGRFRGVVSNGWVKASTKSFRLFGFEYRGEILESNGNCFVDLLITPTAATMIALLLIAVPVFLGFVFAAMMLTFGSGLIEGSAMTRSILILIMLLLTALVTLALIEPRKTRRQLLDLLRDAAIAE